MLNIWQIHAEGSHEPIHDLHINPEWKTNVFQVVFISAAVAKAQAREPQYIIICANLQMFVQQRRKESFDIRIEMVNVMLKAQTCAFTEVPAVEAWRCAFGRYPLLALHGRSGSGKTYCLACQRGSCRCPRVELMSYQPREVSASTTLVVP